jgi:hypothetical protein
MERIFRAPIASQQQWPPQYQPRSTQPFTLAAPPPLGALPPPELFEEPDPLLPPPDPPAPAALAPTAEMGMAVPVNEVANSPASITQAAPPLPSNEQVSWRSSSCHTVAPWTMVPATYLTASKIHPGIKQGSELTCECLSVPINTYNVLNEICRRTIG